MKIAAVESMAVQGLRPAMEDVVAVQQTSRGISLLGVFDGHGPRDGHGAHYAQRLADELVVRPPQDELLPTNGPQLAVHIGQLAAQANRRFEEEYWAAPDDAVPYGGSTATEAILVDGEPGFHLLHSGDSAAIWVPDEGGATLLTEVHSTANDAEVQRMAQLQPPIRVYADKTGDKFCEGPGTLGIMLSKAFGDFEFGFVWPDTTVRPVRLEGRGALILASDVVWGSAARLPTLAAIVRTAQRQGGFRYRPERRMGEVAERLIEAAGQGPRGLHDNASVVAARVEPD